MAAPPNAFTCRPHATARLRSACIGALLLALGIALFIRQAAVGTAAGMAGGMAFCVLGMLALADLWRSVRIDGETLIAQGRLSRRRLRLRELSQAGMSTYGRPWVAPADGRAFYLRMVADAPAGATPGVNEFPEAVRSAAHAAGAQLEPALTEPTPPPAGARPVFSS